MPVVIIPSAEAAALDSEPSLTLGLVNNMGKSGFQASERQFVSLLQAASPGIDVHLLLFTFDGDDQRYRGIDALLHTDLDGLLITGREPVTPDLRDEFYWRDLTRVLDWARTHTRSTICSCLAAHAAVLHLDGIARRRRPHKLSGIFPCRRQARHLLTEGLPDPSSVPHSRWNGLDEDELTAHGYTALTRTEDGDVDAFVKQERQQDSLFVFFQGHPEYETDTLAREYRRDVIRYFRGQSDTYPEVPRNFFSQSTEAALRDLAGHDHAHRFTEVMALLEEAPIDNTWREAAVTLYRNWLEFLCKAPGSQAHLCSPTAASL